MKKLLFYRNSYFSINRYFSKPQFKARLLEASTHGKDVFYNEVRKLNNCRNALKEQGDIFIKDIFLHYWSSFKSKYINQLSRPGIIDSIESMMSCHNFDNGFTFYQCPSCNDFYMMGFSCHSRFCSSCGQKYKNQRTIKVSEKCLNVPHRQFVFTVPSQLWKYFRIYRDDLLNVLFSSVNETLNIVLEHNAPIIYKQEKRRFGFICFLHTFGRDLKFYPHIHVLIAERFFNKFNQLKKYDYFSFDFIRKTFQNVLFHNIYQYFKDVVKDYILTRKIYLLLQDLRNTYKEGCYFYGPILKKEIISIKDTQTLTNYIARYASHPPISERRIVKVDYSSNQVTWFYDPHEDDDINDDDKKLGRQYVTEDVFEFMKKLIVHIPTKGFQQIRYYGFYSNKFKDKISITKLFTDAQLTKMLDNTYWVNGLKSSFGYNPLLCKCGSLMILNLELSYFP